MALPHFTSIHPNMPSTATESKISKQKMREEARRKALQYKKDKLSSKPKKTTPKKQNTTSLSPKTPKSAALANAKAYGEKLQTKKGTPSASASTTRASVFDVTIPAESEGADSFSQTSGSFETAATHTESACIRELKLQKEKWAKARDDADEHVKRLQELIDQGECHVAMDLD